MKIIAMYLPQFHSIPENDRWWGNGYTEWTAVRTAKKLFHGHKQPKIPLGRNYYDLSEPSGAAWKTQARLAKQYGVDGFCIYHYWFETGKQLLEKPTEILLDHPEIELPYCFCWANETWTKTWYDLDEEILMKQKYLDETEWINHYQYLKRFFQDKRYIKIDGKPMICIYHSKEIEVLPQMIECWQKKACEDGFPGLFIVSGNTYEPYDERDDIIDAYYNFEPGFSSKHNLTLLERFECWLKQKCRSFHNKFSLSKKIENEFDTRIIYRALNRCSYKINKPIYPGIFPAWDNTPRRSYKGTYYKNSSPELFGKKLKEIILSTQESFLFINAWNEWGEGCYLEPDEENRYAYLEKVREAVDAAEKIKGER